LSRPRHRGDPIFSAMVDKILQRVLDNA
jgi:hypothetical protein